MKPAVSLLYMTVNRFPQCVERLVANLERASFCRDAVEILWADNGSDDPERIRSAMFEAGLPVTYSRINSENEGIARTLNQLMLRAQGRHIVQMGNDYAMPEGWLGALVHHADNIANTGMVGIRWQEQRENPRRFLCRDGGSVVVDYRPTNKPLFGVKLKTRAMLDKVGGFDERFHPYGFEDSDYHHRATAAGFFNYYVMGMKARHIGDDTGRDPLRPVKDEALKRLQPYYDSKSDNYATDYYQPWPDLRPPL